MRRSKAEVQRYIENAQNSAASPREKSMKGFLFAKLYYEAKEYELAKRNVSSYINVQERDPNAHKFLGRLYEIEGSIEKAVGCYKRSLELNPTQKDLVLKIAELICTLNITDGRGEYWVMRASKLFPGSPVIYRLKEQLLNAKGEADWNQLFDLIQSELFARPDDVYVNIRLVELFRSNKRLDEAMIHCLKPERRALRTNLEWCSCVVQVLKEYLSSHQGSDNSNWRTINKELLLAHADVVFLTLSTRDVLESKEALERFDQALLSVKSSASGTDSLSLTFVEMRGHYYMHAGTLLLKMAQQSEVSWKVLIEPAALCYLLAFQVQRPKSKPLKGEEHGQDLLEGLACDRQSQSGHMLLTLSHGKPGFLSEVIETFANQNGQSILLQFLFEDHLSVENSFLGSDNIRNIVSQSPDLNELCRSDHGAVRLHNGNLQHLTWLGLQWHFMATLPTVRKWLKPLFPRLPLETSRLESNAPESICILDLEVFLLAVVFTSHLQLQENRNTSNDEHRPRCLPLPICKQLCTDRQRSWWDALHTLINKKALPGTAAKLRLVIQHDLATLRALEKHGLQPALLLHWARSLGKTASSQNSFYDQREYIGRCVHYWKKVLPLIEIIKQKKSIPEPVDPLFKHFHSKDIKLPEVMDIEDEASVAFATLDVIDGRTEDAILAFEAIKNVVSYWNLALVYQQKAEDLENGPAAAEEQEESQNYLQKCKKYLMKIIDECSADSSMTVKSSDEAESTAEVMIVYELTPTPEQRALAEKLLLPPTFFCYKNKPGYVSDESDIDDEVFESAVKSLNGQLYPDKAKDKQTGSNREPVNEFEKECVIVWEKKPTPKEKAKADSLKLPSTFFCGVGSDTDEDKDNPEDFDTEIRKVKEAKESQKGEVSSSSEVKVGSDAEASASQPPKYEEPDSTTNSALLPVDLSSKIEHVKPDSTTQGFAGFKFGLNSGSEMSFAALASSSSGDFAFGSKDTNFQWANTGAAVFSTLAQSAKGENEDGSDDEVVHSDEVHFEPIVSLPEVEVKSGEEDEEILFKERAKLYRWDRDVGQWKERGVGEIKILFHREKQYYRVLMRREQVLKVCANHIISKAIKISPLNTSTNSLVWTATDYSDGEGKVEQLAARFKNEELADSFQRKFEECQQNLPEQQNES
ncbi:ranBP2-like and GRIP domain-containing protein 3 [Rhinophrynus dorsalis]